MPVAFGHSAAGTVPDTQRLPLTAILATQEPATRDITAPVIQRTQHRLMALDTIQRATQRRQTAAHHPAAIPVMVVRADQVLVWDRLLLDR